MKRLLSPEAANEDRNDSRELANRRDDWRERVNQRLDRLLQCPYLIGDIDARAIINEVTKERDNHAPQCERLREEFRVVIHARE